MKLGVLKITIPDVNLVEDFFFFFVIYLFIFKLFT